MRVYERSTPRTPAEAERFLWHAYEYIQQTTNTNGISSYALLAIRQKIRELVEEQNRDEVRRSMNYETKK